MDLGLDASTNRATMARTNVLLLLCLALSSNTCHGYIRSQHPSGRVDIAKVGNVLLNTQKLRRITSSTASPNGRRKRVRVEPVLDINPLEKIRQEEYVEPEASLAPPEFLSKPNPLPLPIPLVPRKICGLPASRSSLKTGSTAVSSWKATCEIVHSV